MPFEQTCLLELRERTIDSRQANVHVLAEQHPIHVVSRQVPHLGFFEQLENPQARCRCFESEAFQVDWFAHGLACMAEKGVIIFGYDIPQNVSSRFTIALARPPDY